MTWGTPVEIERRRRFKLLIWAYAYEFRSHSIVPDAVFDAEAAKIDVRMDTGNAAQDFWWRGWFEPFTAIWIHNHPDLDKIRKVYEEHYAAPISQTI